MDDEASSGLSRAQREALSEFNAGYITAGQLSERLAGRRATLSTRARGAASALSRRPTRAPLRRRRFGARRSFSALLALIVAAGTGVAVGITVGSQPVPAAVHGVVHPRVVVRKHHRHHTTTPTPVVQSTPVAPPATTASSRRHSKPAPTTSTGTATNPPPTTTTGSSTSTSTASSTSTTTSTPTTSTTTPTGPATSTSTSTGTGTAPAGAL